MRKNLIDARKTFGLTQNNVAQKLGVTTRHYQMIEAGTSDGSVQVWYKLKALFSITIDELLEQDINTGQV